MEENRTSDLITSALESVKDVVDSNTVIGTPITTPQGTMIIPVSKVSVGFAGGGSDFANKKDTAKKDFAGGGGTGVTATPIGFLIVDAGGGVKFISVKNPAGNDLTVAELAEKIPAFVAKLKDLVEKKKSDKGQDEKDGEDGE